MAETDGVRGVAVPDQPVGEGVPDLLHWTCSLQSLRRLEADPDDDDGGEVFGVTFQVEGVNASAEVEILVTDHEDEVEIIAIALDTLHRAMRIWGSLTENRRIAARDVIA